MLKTTTQFGLLLILLVLLSGCGNMLGSAVAASSTPTIVPLPAVTQTPSPTASPTLSPSPSPSPSPTPSPVTPSPTLSSTTPISVGVTVTPSVVSGQTVKPVVKETATAGKFLSGDWDFTFGSMSLTQRDTRVEGTYQWYGGIDTGQIQGIALEDLNQFQGLWFSNRNSSSQGILRWQLNSNWDGFTGKSESSTNGQWCGVRSGQPLPDGCGFSGIWQLHFGNPDITGQATLVQTGQTVQGTYVDSQGHKGEIVDGVITVQSITEAILTGTWRNDQGQQDSFEWHLDLTTDKTFQGRRNPGNSEWCGWRGDVTEPEPCGWEY